MNRCPLWALPVLTIALGLTACSGSKTPAAAPTGISRPAAAAQYAQLVAAGSAAIATMNTALAKVPRSATGPDVAKITDPAAIAIDAVCQKLLRAPWPSNTAADIKSLVTADEIVVHDLSGLADQSNFSVATWETQFDTDVAKSHGAASAVRADLGLPAA